MPTCNYDAPNGEKSLLYDQLQERLGEDEATRVWMYLHSAEFGQQHLENWHFDDLVNELKAEHPEDWLTRLRTISSVKFHLELDERGEPTLQSLIDRGIVSATGQPATPAPRVMQALPAVHTEQSLFGTAKKVEDRRASEEVLQNIRQVYDAARANPGQEYDLSNFKTTGANRKSTSAYTPLEMARMLASIPIPENVRFTPEFEALIRNTASYQLEHMSTREVPLLSYDESALRQAEDSYKVPIRGADGTPTGEHFTAQQQTEAADSIVYALWKQNNANPNLFENTAENQGIVGRMLRPASHPEGAGLIYNEFRDLLTAYQNGLRTTGLTPEQVAGRIESLQNVLNSWNDFVERALYRLQSYGIKVKQGRTRPEDENINEETGTDATQDEHPKAGEAFFDSSFERDPKDTASARVKIFLASIQDAEVGLEREPKHVNLRFSDPGLRKQILGEDLMMGKLDTSFRTPEQLAALGMQVGGEYLTTIDGVKFRATVEKALDSKDVQDDELLARAEHEDFRSGEEHPLKEGDALVRLKRWVPDPQKVQVKQNFIGYAKLVDFENLFQELLEITSGVPNTYEAMTAAIQEEVKNFRPTLSLVLRRLAASDPQMKNEFVKVMSKQYQEYSITLFSRDRSGFLKMNSINANSGSAVTSIVNQWRENQKHAEIIHRDATGNMVVNRELSTDLFNQVRAFADRATRRDLPHVQDELKPLARRILQANGIVLPDAALDYLFTHAAKVTNGTTLSGSIHDQFAFSADGTPRGIFSAIVAKLVGATEESQVDDSEYLLNNNPLYTENTTMRILAKLAYKFSPRTAAGSHRNSEGKTVYSYGMRTHLSNTIDALKSDQRFRTSMAQTFLGKHNWLLNRLTSGQIKDEFGLRYVDGLKPSDRPNASGITRNDMSSREQLLFALGQFQNGGYKTGNYISLTHSDKTTTPLFTGLPKFGITHDGYAKETRDAIYNTFLGEYERIAAWHARRTQATDGTWQNPTTKNDSYNKGGGLFYQMPFLNHDWMAHLVKTHKISPEEMSRIWIGKDRINPNIPPNANQLIMKLFDSEFTQKEVKRMTDNMRNEGFMEQKLMDERYMNKSVAKAGLMKMELSPREYTYFRSEDAHIPFALREPVAEGDVIERMQEYAAKDYLVNSFLVHTALSGLAFGDPTLTYKPGKTSILDYQKVEDTMKEYQKRLAKDIAPGQDPTWDNGPTEEYKTLTIQDDERVHPELEHVYDAAKINGSDAQEWTTVREHLYVMKAMGTLSEKTYNDMVKIIDDGVQNHPDKYYEFTDPSHLGVVMQIMKPVAVSHNFHEVEGLDTIQYVKSSSMPLYPPMLKGMQIDEIRKTMEGDGKDPSTHIPRTNFISAKKEGAPIGKGYSIFDGDGNVRPTDTTSKAWTDSVQVLTRDGFRIQQEVPYDELKDAILMGSQQNKLFTEGIDHIENFSVRGVDGPLSGVDLKQQKEDIRKQMINLQLSEFAGRMGLDSDGVADHERLVQMLVQEAQSRNYSPNDILMLQRMVERPTDNGTQRELAIPLFFHPSSAKLESMLMSLVKGIGKVYMPGKSYIQASNAGMKFSEKRTFESLTKEEKQGIVWVEGYEGGELQTMQRGEGSSKPAQVLMPFNFITKNAAGEDVKADVKDFIKTLPDGRKVLDTDKIPKELIQVLGFRIPTQKHNSMLPIEVAGFIPANMGDALVVPAAITLQMGSDFDVDKLYTYRRPYKYDKETGGFKLTRSLEQSHADATAHHLSQHLGREVASDADSLAVAQNEAEAGMNDDQKSAFREAQATSVSRRSTPNMDQLTTRYFDLAWSVLTHPDMYDTVMSPLDKPDLKAEAARAEAAKPKEPSNYFSAGRQLEDFLSQKDAKVMVGISSLAVVFTGSNEDKNLRVEKTVTDEDAERAEGEDAPTHQEPNGISFIAEGEEEVRHAHLLSGKGEGRYYQYRDDKGELKAADVEQRMTATGLQHVLVDPISGKVVGTVDQAVIEKRTKLDDLTSLQSEFLDHAKNRTIDKLNINLNTIHAALAMASLSDEAGRKPNLKHLSIFLRQPALVDLVERLGLSQDSLSSTVVPDVVNTTIDEMVREHVAKASELDETASPEPGQSIEDWLKESGHTTIDLKAMKQFLDAADDDADWHLHQAGMLLTFRHLTEIGKELGQIQKLFNQDPRGPGKNMISVLDTISKRQNVGMGMIQGADEIFHTETGHIHRVELDTAATAFREALPYHTIAALVGETKKLTGRDMSLENQQDFVEHFKSYIFSDSELGLTPNVTLDRFRLMYGSQTEQPLASRVWEAQNTWGGDNYFLNRLQPQLADIPNTPSYVFYRSSRVSTLDDQENTAALLELLQSQDEQRRRLGEDLVRYAYVTGGISGSLSFITHIPPDFLTALPFAGRLREVNRFMQNPEAFTQYSHFVDQWAQHNPAMMPKITVEALAPFGRDAMQPLGERFELPAPSPLVKRPGNELGKLLRPNADTGHDEYPEYLGHYDKEDRQWKLYRKRGTTEYTRVDTLGNSYINEYHLGVEGNIRSIITENRALIRQEGFGPRIDMTSPEYGFRHPDFNAENKFKLAGKDSLQPFELNHLLKQFRDDKSVGADQRELSRVLDEITHAIRDTRPIAMDIDRELDNKGRATSEGRIAINPHAEGMDGAADMARVVNHEIIHALTFPFANSTEAMRAKYPEATEAYNKVKESYSEAKEAVVAELEKAGFSEDLAKKALSGQAVPEKMKPLVELYYTVNNINEFITSTLTKENLQKFLNEKQSKLEPKTLLGKLVAAFHGFVSGMAKALGIDVKSGSMLERALERSFKFLEEQQNPDIEHLTSDKLQSIIHDYLVGKDMTRQDVAEQVVAKINEDFTGMKASLEQDSATGKYKVIIAKGFQLQSNFSPDEAESKAVTNPIDKVYGKVQEQIQDIRASIAKNRASLTPEILRQQRLLSELKLLAQDLKASQDMNKIADMAHMQIKWATKVADQVQKDGATVSVNQIMTAHRLSSLWTDVIRLVYGGAEGTSMDPDQRLAEAQSKAQLLNNRFTSSIMPAVMKDMAARAGVDLKSEDFKNIQDLPMAEAKFLSLERAKSKLVQEVARTIQNAHRNYLEDGERTVGKIADFEKRAKAIAAGKGLKVQDLYNSMFQKGTHWGMVDEYSSSFYKWKSGLKSQLVRSIDKINEEVSDPRARATAINDAHAKYWRDLKRKAQHVDVRTIFDEKGEIRDTPKANKMYHDLIDEYGKESADRLVLRAQEKFKQYLGDKESAFASYESEVANGLMTKEEAETAKGQWELENSPVHKLATQESVLDTKRVNVAEKYLELVPRKNATAWDKSSFFDENFSRIMEDKDTKALYTEVKGMMETFKSNLPFYLEDKLGPNFLPAIKQHLINDISQVPEYVKSLPRKMLNTLTASTYEEWQQARTRKDIPVNYVGDPLASIGEKPGKGATQAEWEAYNKKREEALSSYTKNLPRMLELFGLMSLHYKHFSDAKDSIDLGHEVLKKVDSDMSSGMQQVEINGKKVTVNGGLKNTLGSIQYAIDSLVYKRTKDLEGKLGEVHLKNKQEIEKSVKELRIETEDLKKKYRNNELSQEEYETRMKEINNQLDRYEVRRFYGSKIGDALITWSQMKALSYNPISSVNNVAFGLISAQIHANGKEDFDNASFRKAFSIMLNSTGKSLRIARMTGDDSHMSRTARKVLALMNKLGVMGELIDGTNSHHTNVEHREGSLKQTLSPMQMMRTGDYFCKGLNTLATMLYNKVEVGGKEMSLWDAFDENGDWVDKTDKRWHSEDVAEQTELHKLRNKVIGVNKIIMGNQDKSSPIWAKKSVLWRLVGQFRLSWFAEGIASRFEGEREDIQLGRVRKGRYRTYADLGPMQSAQVILRQMASALPGVDLDPYKNARLKSGKEMSNTDKANMRRNVAELGWFLMIYGAMHSVAAMSDPNDDDAKKREYKFMANMLTRSYQDVALYSNPSVFDSILGTPAPALSTIKDTQNFIAGSAKLMYKDDYTWDKWFSALTRAGFIPQTTLINKYKTMTSKDLSTIAR